MDLSEDRSRLDFFMRKRQKLEAADDSVCTATADVKIEPITEDLPECGYEWPDETCRPSEGPCCCKIEDSTDTAEGAPHCSGMPCKEEPALEDEGCPGPVWRAGSCKECCPSEVAIKAEQWTGQEAFQEQSSIAVKAEPEVSCSPFSNGTPPESQAALKEDQHARRFPSASFHRHFSEETAARDESNPLGNCEDGGASCQLPAGESLPVPGFSRRFGQKADTHSSGISDQGAAEASMIQGRESSKDFQMPDAEADRYATTPQTRVQTLKQEDCEVPWRADSDKSSTEHVDIDVASIDVSEQERILQSIASDRERMHTDIAKSLLKRRQSSMAAFLKKDKLQS